jgi:hypothetical protein
LFTPQEKDRIAEELKLMKSALVEKTGKATKEKKKGIFFFIQSINVNEIMLEFLAIGNSLFGNELLCTKILKSIAILLFNFCF